MRIAAFESEPDAEATATVLREQGYDSEVIVKDGESYDERVKRFFAGDVVSSEPHAVLISNADSIPFMAAVQHHYGIVIKGEV